MLHPWRSSGTGRMGIWANCSSGKFLCTWQGVVFKVPSNTSYYLILWSYEFDIVWKNKLFAFLDKGSCMYMAFFFFFFLMNAGWNLTRKGKQSTCFIYTLCSFYYSFFCELFPSPTPASPFPPHSCSWRCVAGRWAHEGPRAAHHGRVICS